MTTKDAVFAWAARMAEAACIEPDHFIIQPDGLVYAMPKNRDDDAIAWWPLPYLGPDGEAEFTAGLLFADDSSGVRA